MKQSELIEPIKRFINLFILVFHKDWETSRKMLKEDLFEKDETFIDAEWITNWDNRDVLLSSYRTLQKEIFKDIDDFDNFKNQVKEFLANFKNLLDTDWKYTMTMLSSEDTDSNGTFLNSISDEDDANWQNKEFLVKSYGEVEKLMS